MKLTKHLTAEIKFRAAAGNAPGTTERNHYKCKAFLDWAGSAGLTDIQDVTEAKAKEFVCEFKGAKTTLRGIVQFLRSSWPEPNPWRNIQIKAKGKDRNAFTPEQVQAIFWSRLPDWLMLASQIAYRTGARLGSILALRQCDWDEQTIHFRFSKTGPYTVPTPPRLVPFLRARGAVNGDSLFPGITINYASVTFRYHLRRLDIPGSFHTWRHTYASRLAVAGVDIRHAMLLLNHSNQIVHQAYVHVQPADLKPLVEDL